MNPILKFHLSQLLKKLFSVQFLPFISFVDNWRKFNIANIYWSIVSVRKILARQTFPRPVRGYLSHTDLVVRSKKKKKSSFRRDSMQCICWPTAQLWSLETFVWDSFINLYIPLGQTKTNTTSGWIIHRYQVGVGVNKKNPLPCLSDVC